MATFDKDQPTAELGRFCPECGQPAGNANFCPGCGHNMGFSADRTLADKTLQPSKSDDQKPRGRVGFIIAGGVVGLVAVAIAVIVLLNTHSSNGGKASAAATPAGPAYRLQLTKVLAPVIAANQTVSTSLTAMNGSQQTTASAKTQVAAALAAVTAARGGLRVLTVPAPDTGLSGQVQQALTADNGYLQAVSETLATPSGSSSGQLTTLATGAQSALVNLDPVLAGASASVTGTANLVSWVQGATAAGQAAAKKPRTQTVTSSASAAAAPQQSSTAPSGTPQGLSACDQNISVNSATSCQFADAVFAAYANVVQSNGSPTSAAVTASSPVTGDTYTDNCQYNSDTGIVLCSHGTDLVQFPEWAASVYNP